MTMFNRRRRDARLEASSSDPVAEAIAAAEAGGPLVPQYEDEDPVLAELPQWFDVQGERSAEGFDTVVTFSDEIHVYVDPYESGLEQVLAEQPGIEDVYAADREVVYLRTRLHLADVAAAVIRSVAEANRNPRPPVVDPAAVTEEQVLALVGEVEPLLSE